MSTTDHIHGSSTSRVGPGPLARLRGRPRATPSLILAAGLLLLAVGAGIVAWHIDVWALDETVFEESAAHYTSNLPSSLIHDVNARATDRLYSLVLSIPLRLFNDPAAIQIDHVLGCVLFISAGVPIYLFARRLVRSKWQAVTIALLSVALPWLTLTTALFSENLSYPLFWWAMLACCSALARPALRRDVLVLVVTVLLAVTRIQFVAVFAGYVLAIIVLAVLRWRGGARAMSSRTVAVETLRAYALSAIVVVVALAVLLYLRTTPAWAADAARLLGGYSDVVVRTGLPANMVEGLLIELIALGVGVGLLPAIVSLTWWIKRIATPRRDVGDAYFIGGGTIAVVFLVLTVFSQGGYLAAITEERYFFYVVPLMWIGTFTAFESGEVRPGELVVGGVVLGAVFGTIPFLSPLTTQTAFLAPAESVVQHVLLNRLVDTGIGLSPQDALAIIAFLAGVLAAVLWSRRIRVRLWWTVGLAALVQLVITGYAYATITGHIQGIPGSTGPYASALSWVDRNATSPNVTWLDNVSTTAPPAITGGGQDQPRTTLFWNRHLDNWLGLPQTGLPVPEFPLAAMPGSDSAQVQPRTGDVIPAASVAGIREVVGEVASPFFQLAGRVQAHSPGGALEMQRVALPLRATWVSGELGVDGTILDGVPVRLSAFAPHGTRALSVRLLVVAPPAGSVARTTLDVHLGSMTRKVVLKPGSPTVHTIRFSACAATLTGKLTGHSAAKGDAAGVLEHVIVGSAPATACPAG